MLVRWNSYPSFFFFLVITNDHANRLAKMETQVNTISENVNRLLDRRSKNILSAPISPSTIEASAGEIKDAASWARQRKLPIPDKQLAATAASLLDASQSHPSAPEVWSAVSELVNYKTQMDTGVDAETKIVKQDVRPCAAKPPLVYGDSGGKGKDYVQKTPFEYSDCYLNLDKLELPPIVTNPGGFGIVCKRCFVEYSGGPIPMRTQLLDCFIVLHLSSMPPEAGLRLAHAIVENPKSVVAG